MYEETEKRNLVECASGWEGEKWLWVGRPEVVCLKSLALSQELKGEVVSCAPDKDSRGWGQWPWCALETTTANRQAVEKQESHGRIRESVFRHTNGTSRKHIVRRTEKVKQKQNCNHPCYNCHPIRRSRARRRAPWEQDLRSGPHLREHCGHRMLTFKSCWANHSMCEPTTPKPKFDISSFVIFLLGSLTLY